MNAFLTSFLRGVVASTLLLAACSTASAATASFRGLGFLDPSNPSSVAHGLSGDGTTVVGTSRISDSAGSGFRWTGATGMVAIPLRQPFGVNYDGSIVVGHCPGLGACYWSDATGIVGLPGGPNLSAWGVSADGSVIVGGGYFVAPEEDDQAVVWRLGGPTVEFLHIGPEPEDEDGPVDGPVWSRASGVSADGRVVVGSTATYLDDDTDAFRWTEETGLVFLNSQNGEWSEGTAISADGSTIVGIRSWQGEGTQAFRWTETDGVIVLASVSGPLSAIDVSGDGSRIFVQGGIFDDGVFIGGVRALLQSFGVHDSDDWAGLAMVGIGTYISDSGLHFTGTGLNPNRRTEAWLAVVPEPSSIALGIIGALSLAGGFLANRFQRRPLKAP